MICRYFYLIYRYFYFLIIVDRYFYLFSIENLLTYAVCTDLLTTSCLVAGSPPCRSLPRLGSSDVLESKPMIFRVMLGRKNIWMLFLEHVLSSFWVDPWAIPPSVRPHPEVVWWNTWHRDSWRQGAKEALVGRYFGAVKHVKPAIPRWQLGKRW